MNITQINIMLIEICKNIFNYNTISLKKNK